MKIVQRKRDHSAGKRRLSELSKAERRRAIVKSVITLTATWILLFVAYFLSPVGKLSSGRPLVQLVLAVALIGSALAWQIRGIMKAELPELRAVEALGTFIPFFLLTFSFAYLSMSHNDPHSFTQSLDHVRAIYFTVTTFSTTGYGDITPNLDPVRIVAAIQMLIDLALLGAIIRVISKATSKSFGSEEQSGD
ncbi:MAG: potassium channel family protein [Actinomycetota bacterium]